jgi:transposase
MLKMDEINKIRKDFFTNGLTKSEIAKKYTRSWDTINRIVKTEREDLENRGKRQIRKKKVMTEDVIQAIEAYLDEEVEKNVKRKQRYTARQIYNNLKEKKIYKGSRRRMEEIVGALRLKRNQTKTEAFLPLDFPIGSALQVDHGEADIEVEGIRTKGYLFVASVPGQVLRYCQIFPTKASEAWGEFHEKAFEFFGGVFPRVIYDNDTVLVRKVSKNDRTQTGFSVGLEEHYGFESHFCNLAAGNEKGAVENGVGYCRRRFLAGYPTFGSWDGANQLLSDCCQKDIEEGRHYKTHKKLSDLFEKTKEKLIPCPRQKAWCRWVDSRVDKCQLITVDHHQYSVPEKFVGSWIRVAITIDKVEVFKNGELVTVHPRQYGTKDILELDHYLDQLQKKPSAVRYAKAVTQNNFHPKLMEIWDRLSEKYGNKEANRQFVSILLLRRKWSQEDMLQGVEKALELGAIDHSAVEIILRQRELSKIEVDEEGMKNLIPSSGNTGWSCDLSVYAALCEGVA